MRRLKINKKAYTIGDIPWLAITFGIGIIVLAIVAQIVADVRTDIGDATNATAEFNITTQGLEGLTKIANWLPTIGLVLGAVIVIVALSALFIFKRGE